MAELFIISEWSEQAWWNTGGTRNKKIYLNPEDGQLYFFKESFKKGKRDYKYEFWSEIIASEIGLILGFNVLRYHIAIRNETIGCISKSMLNLDTEELIEGGKYLQAYDQTFNPEDTKQRNLYSFELIVKSIVAFNREKCFPELFDMIVFDALIGNSDRHQENWAFISKHSITSSGLRLIEDEIKSGRINEMPKWIQKIVNKIVTIGGKSEKLSPEFKKARLLLSKTTDFSPIYDSGCSFGRELTDEQVKKMLKNDLEIEKYINKGLAEIHWEGKKINHFLLVEMLITDPNYKELVLRSLKKIMDNYDKAHFEIVVMGIDLPLTNSELSVVLPESRKFLALKILNLRYDKLKSIYNRYYK
jgi:hypothetical protein